MDKIERLHSVTQFNSKRGQVTLHPLVSVLDQSKSSPIKPYRCLSEIYIIFLKDLRCEDFQYGRNTYDYQEETLLFISPGQVFGFDSPEEKLVQPVGWALVFHPDLIKGTSLGKKISEYKFFDYDVAEALHVSESERLIVLDCFRKIREEMERGIDKHSKTLIISNIELFLNYCVRFYDRQFITREPVNKDILTKFESLLKEYFQSELPQDNGIPTVAWCADKLNLSSNYFGDLVKRETGISALEVLQAKVIDLAKEKIFDRSKSISEIAYEMGYKYPQHFTRLFKQRVGMSPQEYRFAN
ncbi:AraC family transcriptional regulator [Algoriphagus sp. A40]|uniref:helix-turn-helix domain-containing protein n=1 Tax=Algoriphagus sp. A40 TaxID=1945863 RepID=UPI0009872CC8|nr:helix-turn-helix transcriptional regulator [Algoriphagus sp. A40]OOG74925.1 AraC family transcriptional regulator [Algoriphagus sp. A40]